MITVLTFAQFTQNWVNQWAVAMSTPGNPVLPNLQSGNFALAVAQADANQATVLQYMAILTTNFARATTCSGPDLDSWMADYDFPRIQAGFATVTVTFTAPGVLAQAAFIPVGTVVTTPGAAIQYAAIADPNNANFNSSTQTYTIPIGSSATNVLTQALVSGVANNVQSGQLSQLLQPIAGVASVTNALSSTGGTDAETDDAYRARFVKYINGLSQATEDAIDEKLITLQAGLKIQLIENVIAVGGNVSTMTIAGMPAASGTTSFVTNNTSLGGGTHTTVYDNVSGDTNTTTLATHLTSAINADSTINSFINATSTGNIITLTNSSPETSTYSCSSNSGTPTFTVVTPIASLIYGANNPLANGNIVALVDDGSGNPSAALIAQATATVANTRAYGIRYQVFVPAILSPAITINVRLVTGAVIGTVLAAIQQQIMTYVNALAIGGDQDGLTFVGQPGYLYPSQIAEQAWLAAPGQIVSVEQGSVTISDATVDYIVQPYQEILIALTDVSVGTY
jgi:hypothetical protein